jgi:hypothetical protein
MNYKRPWSGRPDFTYERKTNATLISVNIEFICQARSDQGTLAARKLSPIRLLRTQANGKRLEILQKILEEKKEVR